MRKLERELPVPKEMLREFLDEVGRALGSVRVKTRFGKELSEHLYLVEFRADGTLVPAIVQLQVRRIKGTPSVFLKEVRPLTEEEIAESDLEQPPTWSREFGRAAWLQVVTSLDGIVTSIGSAALVASFLRGMLAYDGLWLGGEYWAAGWRIGPPSQTPDPNLVSEKVLVCDRMVTGRGALDNILRFQSDLDRLALLLTVFWCNHFYRIPAMHRWVLEPSDTGELTSRLAQLGFVDTSRVSAMPIPGTLSAPGATRQVDRLDCHSWAITSRMRVFEPPADGMELLDVFERADESTKLRFLEAATAYDTSYWVASHTVTGALAYLVVAAESLLDVKLEKCTQCGQVRGMTSAVRKLFLDELPGLQDGSGQVDAFVRAAYGVRSQHFHAARLVAGELERGYPVDTLMPERLEKSTQLDSLRALVNGLLVAWLVRKVTGEPWPRSLQPAPSPRPSQFYQVNVPIGRQPL